ncbi:MAG: MerC domain-containing protein [Chloroflexi bacterium]|nr:MerC domain-containing protein [Chloroflexota bacterium]
MRLVILRILGAVSSIFVALCCLGVPAVIAALSAIGAGFLINDAILAPLLVVALGITVAGSFFTFRQHHNLWPLGLTIASAVVAFASVYIVYLPVVVYGALAVLILTQIGDFVYQRKWLLPV